jgi:O-antigen/teichoic acid export membrane protein
MILLTFPAVLLIAAVHSWQSWAVAEGNFKGLNLIRVAQALIATITQILFGYIYPHPESLAFGYSLGSLIALLVGISFMPINLNIVLQNNFFFRLINFWIKHRRFPLFSLPADFMNTLSSQAPLFFISSNFGDDSAGYFALVVRVLGAPIGFLGASVLDVFKKYAASSFISKGNCHKEYIRVFIILLILSAITTIAVVFFSESLFALAFGNSWEKAGVLAIWLMPLFALRFIASPLSYVFYISGKQHIDLVWQCALFFITIIIFMNCDTFESSIKLYALCYSALYCIYILLSYKFSKGSKF